MSGKTRILGIGKARGEGAEASEARENQSGTTAEALSVLMDPNAWPTAMSQAIAAATRRSRELAG